MFSGWLTDKFDPRILLLTYYTFRGAGVIRDVFGEYTYAWWGGAVMCAVAAALSFAVRRNRQERELTTVIPAEAAAPVAVPTED